MTSKESVENKLYSSKSKVSDGYSETLAAYRCSVCGKYFDGWVHGQLIMGYYKFRAAKPVANLCETCFFIVLFWTGEIAQAAADGTYHQQEGRTTRR